MQSLFRVAASASVLLAGGVASAAVSPTGNITFVSYGPEIPSTLPGIVPPNLATLPGATPFAIDALVTPHTIGGLNDGLYGNVNSWIGATGRAIDVTGDNVADVTTGIAGIRLDNAYNLTGFAFGRDNGGNADQPAGNNPPGYQDRSAGTYYIQTTSIAAPDQNTADAAWTTQGSVEITSATNPDNLRRLFSFNSPVTGVTGLRIVVPGVGFDGVSGTAIDEIEIFGAPVPEPTSLALLGLGGLGLLARRRRA